MEAERQRNLGHYHSASAELLLIASTASVRAINTARCWPAPGP
jgi:hypothetical protein